MSDASEFVGRWIIGLFLCCGLTFVGAYNQGRLHERSKMHRELVESGDAYYSVDRKTGETTFRIKARAGEVPHE